MTLSNARNPMLLALLCAILLACAHGTPVSVAPSPLPAIEGNRVVVTPKGDIAIVEVGALGTLGVELRSGDVLWRSRQGLQGLLLSGSDPEWPAFNVDFAYDGQWPPEAAVAAERYRQFAETVEATKRSGGPIGANGSQYRGACPSRSAGEVPPYCESPDVWANGQQAVWEPAAQVEDHQLVWRTSPTDSSLRELRDYGSEGLRWRLDAGWWADWRELSDYQHEVVNLTLEKRRARAVACGAEHCCALRAGGQVLCWGEDANSPLASVHTAVAVVAAGNESCALLRNGRVACWPFAHREGDPAQPRQVSRLEDAVAVAMSRRIGCAVVRTGRVRCWAPESHSAFDVAALGDVRVLAANEETVCGGEPDGAISCVAIGDLVASSGTSTLASPRQVRLGSVTRRRPLALAAGGNHTCALDEQGSVTCWTFDAAGMTTERTGLPPIVSTNLAQVSLAVGERGACVVAQYGNTTRCWTWDGAPARELGGLDVRLPISLSVGGRRACAVAQSGAVACWDNVEPTAQVVVSEVQAVRVTNTYACALGTRGEVWCWDSQSWQLPARVEGLSDAAQIELSSGLGCALRRNGDVACWGLGRPQRANAVPGLHAATDLAVGPGHACAVRRDGTVACWGSVHAWHGRADGDVLIEDGVHPLILAGIHDAIAVRVNDEGACVRRTRGPVTCWGQGASPTLPGSEEVRDLARSPTRGWLGVRRDGVLLSWEQGSPVSIASEVARVAVGEPDCLVLTSGSAACLDPAGSAPPARRILEPALDIASGAAVCLLRPTGEVACATPSRYPGTPIGRFEPVSGPKRAVSIAVGSVQACALTESGQVWCWKADVSGLSVPRKVL